ncbi:WHG domain-containing protein [Alicyclobacillus tolerans]|nr:WHG domain-containing protein [Alicyclobacillus tolerans]
MRAPEPIDMQIQTASQEIIETLLTVLEPYKLSYDEAVHVIRGFRAIAHGFASLEMSGVFGIVLRLELFDISVGDFSSIACRGELWIFIGSLRASQ